MVHSARLMANGKSRSCRPLLSAGLPLRIASAVLIVAAAHIAGAAAGGAPVRALWVPLSALASATSIERTLSSAVSAGVEGIVAPLVVAARSDSESFDGGAELLRQARARGLVTHVSLPVTLVAAVGELPPSREHVIYQHPEWLMVPRQLASELLKTDFRSPAYLGQIIRWTRANANRVDGLYVSPLDPAAAAFLVKSVLTAVGRYAVDGVYLETLDFPGDDFDYSRRTMELFRTRMRSVMSVAERVRLDEIESIDPFAYAEEFPDEWHRVRESALTDLLGQLRNALKAINPAVSVAVAARADADVSLRDHFQSWRLWLDRGMADRVGYRSRSTGLVLLSPDGTLAPEPERLPATQTAGVGGPR
jgi:glycosyl hydrolase family 10